MRDAKPAAGARVERLMEHLWDGGPDLVYAILDAARDERVLPELIRSELPHHCLFSGDLGADLSAAAPYLVQLRPHSDRTERLLALGWGQSWGIHLASPAPMEELRRHFRRFLRVQGPEGQTLYFRYYDPRVWRVFLPTCNEGELSALFGPVTRYLVEAEDPSKLLVYRRVGPSLQRSTIAWGED